MSWFVERAVHYIAVSRRVVVDSYNDGNVM
jgi:hypothetical protein